MRNKRAPKTAKSLASDSSAPRSKVFISSTCHDLIDARAEIERALSSAGLQPVLSDRATSDFVTPLNSNSIEGCLVNLRNCDVAVFILSQRYGASLKGAGFDDISATHLEYREAKAIGMPILFLVRDRLAADYAIWKRNRSGSPARKRNQSAVLAWTKDPELLQFMDEHCDLKATSKHSNWYWPFVTSIDLCETILKHLHVQVSRAALVRMIAEGRCPLMIPTITAARVANRTRKVTLRVRIVNYGASPAIQPTLSFEGSSESFSLDTLGAGQAITDSYSFTIDKTNWGEPWIGGLLTSEYVTSDGHLIADETFVRMRRFRARIREFTCHYEGKRYKHAAAFNLRS